MAEQKEERKPALSDNNSNLAESKETDDEAGGISIPCPGESYDLRIFQSLRKIIRALDIHSRKLVTKYKITGPQLVCLLEISNNAPVTGTEIAHKVHLSTSTVVGILDRLELKGLVQRKRDRKDRRNVNVIATTEGKQVASDAPSPLQETFADALEHLPPEEQLRLTRSLERIVELMEVQSVKAAPILEAGSLHQEVGDKLVELEGKLLISKKD
ncbi:MAG: MarR family winged helix-turn-helix transcriptional regulator [bacterium]